MSEQLKCTSPLIVFYSYAQEDEALRHELEKHLSLLQRQGTIATWHNRQIVPGTNWTDTIDAHLKETAIILLLISPDFLASDYCYCKEMQLALKRHEQGLAHVIPILLRPVDWQDAPFSHLQSLPSNKQPVTLWENRDVAFFEVTVGIRTAVARIHASVGQKISCLSTPISRQNRQRLLKRMRTFWIQGMLDQSLHQASIIALGLQEQPDALANPWSLIVQETERTARLLPAGTRIIQIYDESDGALLILGEPGSGKTTLLLELARDLLGRAEQDETHPMPVVFNLSSWAVKRQPLMDWLAEELYLRYQVPSQLAKSWIATDRVLPLLDGLDEVAPTHRVACLEEINMYRSEHDLISLVVCSRSKEYFSQTTRILLHSAVTVQPLTVQQIDEYLVSVGEQLTTLRTILHQDEVLLKLATNPLILSVLTLTYHGKTIEELTTTGSPEVRRRQIFAAYVQRMFEHRGAISRYTPQQTIRWLGWLASQMALHNQTEFYLESMQPDWLWEKSLRRYYGWTVGRVMTYIMWALLQAVYSGPLAVLIAILVSTIPVEISKVLFGALIGTFGGVLIYLVNGIMVGWRKGLYTAIVGIPMGALAGVLVSEISLGLNRPTMALIVGLVTGVMIGLLTAITGGEVYSYSGIVAEPILGWSWEDIQHSFSGKIEEGRAISVIGGTSIILIGTVVTVERGVLSGLGIGGVTLLAELLLFVLYSGIRRKALSKQVLIAPNQGIWLSARKGFYFCLATGSCAFLGTWLVISNVAGSLMGWMSGLTAGCLCGIAIGWFEGWDACVRHLMLRVLLWHAGSLPRNYIHFLDYAVERILLRKIGGGYIFIHRLLLEYFALLTMTKAETEHSQAADPKAKDVTIYHNRGLLFVQFGKDDQAIRNYTRAIELDPKEASIYRDRGLAYTRRKEYQHAIADYTSVIDLEPENAWAYHQRGIAYRELKEYEEAIADFTHAIKLAPQTVWFYINRGQIYTDLQEYEKAIADLSTAIELAPQVARFYDNRGYAYLWLKKCELAHADYEQYAALLPKSIKAAWLVIYSDLGKQRPGSEIVEALEKIVAIEPQSSSAQFCRGVALGLENNYSDGIVQLEQAIKLRNLTRYAYFWKGLFCAYLEQEAEATQAIMLALEAGLPPVLLTPLYWLEQERPEIYQSVAAPFLVQYSV